MAGRNVREFREKHGRLVKGWRKIQEQERGLDAQHKFLKRIKREFSLSKLPLMAEALALDGAGRKLSAMGEKRLKVSLPKRRSGKPKLVQATFVSGGLPSLGKSR
jgi:hypothetical protein